MNFKPAFRLLDLIVGHIITNPTAIEPCFVGYLNQGRPILSLPVQDRLCSSAHGHSNAFGQHPAILAECYYAEPAPALVAFAFSFRGRWIDYRPDL